jgi:hypothetical protein
MMDVSDTYILPIFGYRGWVPREGKLSSYAVDYFWIPKKANVAQCGGSERAKFWGPRFCERWQDALPATPLLLAVQFLLPNDDPDCGERDRVQSRGAARERHCRPRSVMRFPFEAA